MSRVREIVLSRAEPSNIELSSIGGWLYFTALDEDQGVYIQLGPDGREVKVGRGDEVWIRLSWEGPRAIDVKRAMEKAARSGFLLSEEVRHFA